MAENTIHFSNLFDSDVEQGLISLKGNVDDIHRKLKEMQTSLGMSAKEMGDALRKTSSASEESRKSTKKLAEAVEELDFLWENLSQEEQMLVRSAQEVSIQQGNLTKVTQKAVKLAREQETSYNRLAAQYDLLKVKINAMTKAERENTDEGRALVAQASEIYEEMKRLQEATGKMTLNVGNYEKSMSKAMTGLNLATQQVLREMPTIANSWSQFVIAISNNVPMLTDAFQRVRLESGSTMKAIMGVARSVLSWQTAMLTILTILPGFVRKLEQKKRAQEEANKATQEALKYEAQLAEAELNVGKAVIHNVSDLQTLHRILNDTNRTWEERVQVGKYLKAAFDEELEGFTAEEIAMGNAEIALKQLTDRMIVAAEAKAYLTEIGNLSVKQLTLERQATNELIKVRSIEAELDAARAKQKALLEQQASDPTLYEELAQDVADVAGEIYRLNNSLDEQRGKWMDVDSQIQDTGNVIATLRDRIKVFGLEIEEEGGRLRTEKLVDYYWEWYESTAKIIQEETDREIALNNISYEHKIANYGKALEELKANGKLTIDQEEYLTGLILNAETERQQKRQEIIWKYYDKWWKEASAILPTEIIEEAIDEQDDSITARYDKILANVSARVLDSRLKLNQALQDNDYKTAKEEGARFKALTIEKLQAEANYQKELLKMRLDTKEITQDIYDKELAEIELKLGKSIANLAPRRQKKFNIWAMMFGETTEDGKGNIFKELNAEQQAFIQGFKQTMNMAFQYMNEWMDKRIEMAQVAVDAAQKEKDAAKSVYDYELQAMANGYANNVEYARKEYEKKLALEKKAIAEKERLAAIQEQINTAMQISSLVTATAELWMAHGSIPVAGPIMAAAATAAMWGAFAASKIQAAQLARAKTYGEGGMEYMNYGGSHASGNDIDFGRTRDGRQRRVERGEIVGIINKRSVAKYGVGEIGNLISSLNNGTFDKYSLAFQGGTTIQASADLSNIESGLGTLINQGKTRIVYTDYGRIEYNGNNKRIIRKS